MGLNVWEENAIEKSIPKVLPTEVLFFLHRMDGRFALWLLLPNRCEIYSGGKIIQMNLIAVSNTATVLSRRARNLITSLYSGNSLLMLQQM